MSTGELADVQQQWIRDGRAMPLPEVLSRDFDVYLNRLPWLGAALDWSKIQSFRSFNLVGTKRRDFDSWIATTSIGKHTHMAIWYSRIRGGLVVPMAFAIANLDALYRHAPGIRFAFGVDFVEGQIRPAYGDLLQYGSGDELVAVAPCSRR